MMFCPRNWYRNSRAVVNGLVRKSIGVSPSGRTLLSRGRCRSTARCYCTARSFRAAGRGCVNGGWNGHTGDSLETCNLVRQADSPAQRASVNIKRSHDLRFIQSSKDYIAIKNDQIAQDLIVGGDSRSPEQVAGSGVVGAQVFALRAGNDDVFILAISTFYSRQRYPSANAARVIFISAGILLIRSRI